MHDATLFMKKVKKSVAICNSRCNNQSVQRTREQIVAEAALSRRLTKAVPNLSQLAQEAGVSRQRLTILADEYNEKLETENKDGEHGDQTITPQSSTIAVNNLNGIEHTAQTSTNGGA